MKILRRSKTVGKLNKLMSFSKYFNPLNLLKKLKRFKLPRPSLSRLVMYGVSLSALAIIACSDINNTGDFEKPGSDSVTLTDSGSSDSSVLDAVKDSGPTIDSKGLDEVSDTTDTKEVETPKPNYTIEILETGPIFSSLQKYDPKNPDNVSMDCVHLSSFVCHDNFIEEVGDLKETTDSISCDDGHSYEQTQTFTHPSPFLWTYSISLDAGDTNGISMCIPEGLVPTQGSDCTQFSQPEDRVSAHRLKLNMFGNNWTIVEFQNPNMIILGLEYAHIQNAQIGEPIVVPGLYNGGITITITESNYPEISFVVSMNDLDILLAGSAQNVVAIGGIRFLNGFIGGEDRKLIIGLNSMDESGFDFSIYKGTLSSQGLGGFTTVSTFYDPSGLTIIGCASGTNNDPDKFLDHNLIFGSRNQGFTFNGFTINYQCLDP